jgi:hypothetical protein
MRRPGLLAWGWGLQQWVHRSRRACPEVRLCDAIVHPAQIIVGFARRIVHTSIRGVVRTRAVPKEPVCIEAEHHQGLCVGGHPAQKRAQ